MKQATQRNSLGYWRKKKGISQAELAKALGLNRTYISAMEQGIIMPSPENVQEIAAMLEVPPTSIWEL